MIVIHCKQCGKERPAVRIKGPSPYDRGARNRWEPVAFNRCLSCGHLWSAPTFPRLRKRGSRAMQTQLPGF